MDKPALKDRFADVFGGLEALEAKHEDFVRKNLKGKSEHWKDEPAQDDVMESKQRRDKNDSSSSRRDSGSSSYCHRRDERSSSRRDRSGERRFASYKRGQGRNRTPDFRVHPDKWVRYDLSDVDKSQLSERSNTAAAFSFLNDLRKQKEQLDMNDVSNKSDDVTAALPPDRIIFKKPLRRAGNKSRSDLSPKDLSDDQQYGTQSESYETDQDKTKETLTKEQCQEQVQNSEKIVFKKPKAKSSTELNIKDTSSASMSRYRDGALVMPEYVIGSKPVKSTSTKHNLASKRRNIDLRNEIKLSYLDEDDGEGNDSMSDNEDISDKMVVQKGGISESVSEESKMDHPEAKPKRHRRNIRQTRITNSGDQSD